LLAGYLRHWCGDRPDSLRRHRSCEQRRGEASPAEVKGVPGGTGRPVCGDRLEARRDTFSGVAVDVAERLLVPRGAGRARHRAQILQERSKVLGR